MFWLNNIEELLKPIIAPNYYMKFEDKLNAIIRFILFIGIVSALIFNDARFIIFIMVAMIVSIIVYYYYMNVVNIKESFLNENNLKVIDNKICVKPTQNNPFMNPSIVDIKYTGDDIYGACPVKDEKISDLINKEFYKGVFRDVEDLYNKNGLDRQFYSMPSSTIPNEANKLGDWLYNNGKTCKEDNGAQCYNNIFTDIRRNANN
jgi:hypothetical protein